MSKNSNENQLNSRLKNIFNDLNQPREFPGLKSLSDLTGWIWEMDLKVSSQDAAQKLRCF